MPPQSSSLPGPLPGQGDLVDRLLAKIASLEARLQDASEGVQRMGKPESLIKAVTGAIATSVRLPVEQQCLHTPPTPCCCWTADGKPNAPPCRAAATGTPPATLQRTAAEASAAAGPHARNAALLQTLGDPDQHHLQLPPAAGALASGAGDWLGSVGTWVRQRASAAKVTGPPGGCASLPSPGGGQEASAAVSGTSSAAASPVASAAASPEPAVHALAGESGFFTAGRGSRSSAVGAAAGLLGRTGGLATASSAWGALRHYSRCAADGPT
jgi:hypothetical protein